MLMNFDLEYERYFHACLRMWWRLCFKMLFSYKCIRIIFFYYIKNLFLISVHQDDPKILKNNFKQKQIQILNKQYCSRNAKDTLQLTPP
jgi:hypothetical protein